MKNEPSNNSSFRREGLEKMTRWLRVLLCYQEDLCSSPQQPCRNDTALNTCDWHVWGAEMGSSMATRDL